MKYMNLRRDCFLIIVCATVFTAYGQQPFSFQGTNVKPGAKNHFKMAVTDGKDSTYIPVTVFHGSGSGPVLGITAGVHGYEYPPIMAAQHMIEKLDPAELYGTVILVQAANIPGFLQRTPSLNPQDNKDLNRSFPGNAKGTITERMAYTIVEKVIARSDYFLDMHAGDAPEDLMPYNAWYDSPALPEVSAKGRAMALAMGFDYSIRFNVAKERLSRPSVYCSQEAFHRKIPAVDIECGRLGIPGTEERDSIVSAIFSLLAHLRMLPPEPQLVTPTIIAKRATITSEHTGIFYSDIKAGDALTKGETVGYITDFFGKKLTEVIADTPGIVLYMIGTPPISKGETLVSIGLTD